MTSTTPSTTSEPSSATTTTSAPSGGSGDAMTLAFNFAKGDTLKFDTTTESTSEGGRGGPNGGGGRPEAMKMSVQQVVKVTDVNGGKAKIELTVDNVKVDGQGDASRMTEQATRQAKGMKVTASYDATGKVSDMKTAGDGGAASMLTGIGSSVGFMGLNFPSGPVRVGDSWKTTWDFKASAGRMLSMLPNPKWANTEIPTTYTLKSIDRDAGTAVIAFTSAGKPSITIEMNMANGGPGGPRGGRPGQGGGPGGGGPGGGAGGQEGGRQPGESRPTETKMTMTFELTASGTMVVDLKTGYPKEITSDTTSKMVGGPMAMTQKSKSRTRRVQ
jgi:hypothetical protein